MSRARRQQRKRARRWALEVRDTVFGWRASWWHNGREMHPAYHFPKVENRLGPRAVSKRRVRVGMGWELTGRTPSRPELQRLPLRTETGRALRAAAHAALPFMKLVDEFDYAGLEARIAARVREGGT